MKTSLLAFFIFCFFSTYANNYYFSSSLGDDTRTALQAQNPSTPWKTLNQLNSFFSSLHAGDAVLFQRGDVFYGSLKISMSGTSANRIVFDAYGSGANPVITGFTTVSSWSNLGSNIWESISAVSALSTTNMVLVNGVNTPMGRYPNSGYLTYQTFSGNTSITSSSINSATTNWTGAEAVIKKTKWILDRGLITSHSGGTLVYSGGGYVGRSKFGFFIQNDSRTLDQQNEWYYNPSTKKIRIYSSGTPAQVQLSTVDTLVFMTYSNYITFNNISFTGANGNAFWIGSSSNLTIQGCSMNFCYNGITGKNFGASSANFILQNCTINHSNNNAVDLSDEFSSATLTNNAIDNTAMIPGAGGSGDGTYNAMSLQGSNSTIKYNAIDTVGYNGITFFGNSVNVSNNKVNNFCTIKSDGGGIYTRGINSNMIIANNIVINGIGNIDGVYNPTGVGVIGIYCDGTVSDIHILNNSIANINNAGIYLHNPVSLEVKNNTVYNCTYTGFLIKNDDSTIFVGNLSINNNIFLARDSVQLASKLITLHNDISNWGNIDSNYYARPKADNSVFAAQPFGEDGVTNYYNLAQWKSYSHLDAHSLKSPKTITDLNDLRFEYNATLSNKTVSLDANYIDVTGKTYSNNIVLQPYTSLVLIKTGATQNKAPTINITSPVNNATFASPASINITVSASDDGSIAKVDFYNGSTLIGTANSSPYSFTWNITAAGNYSLTAKATDNGGLTTTSPAVVISASVTANLAPPVINMTSPGNNATYNNPATINLSASASDADGTVSKVEFFNGSTLLNTQLTSPYSFNWANVPAGNYSLTARATDNDGLTTTSAVVSVSVTASGSSGGAPVVNMTSPANNSTYNNPVTINLSAAATDDGSITSVYFFSGTTLLNISYIPPYTFSWNNVPAGNYSLTVVATDNDGLTTTSPVVLVLVTRSKSVAGAPVVKITTPGNNATYKDPATIKMTASASDANGSISKVEFFKGSTLLSTLHSSPYTFTWKNVHAGNYSLTAKATDNDGLTTTSAAVSVSVTGNPVVSITAPKNNATFNSSATITLTASASEANGSISSVEFFKGSTLLNTQHTSPYSYSWKNVPAGSYTITVKAIDSKGVSKTSAAIHISVKAKASSRSSAPEASIDAPSSGSESENTSTEISNDLNKENDKLFEPDLSALINFRLLPNPAVNTIQVYFDGLQAYRKGDLTIYNALGVMVKKYPVIISGKKIDVDISFLSTGIYFIGLSGDDFRMNKKFIKVN